MGRISQDEREYLDIVRRKYREDLLSYLQRGRIKIMGRDKGVAISMPLIEIPILHFRQLGPKDDTGDGDQGMGPDVGIGQGPGKPGTDLGPIEGDDKEGGGERSAGIGRGPEIEIIEPFEDFSELLFKQILKLPRIKPKGEKSITSVSRKYTNIAKVGPESLRHIRRTFKESLKRSIAEGAYDPKDPKIIPIKDDKRYRRAKPIKKKRYNAVVIYMKDVSGSVGDEDRDLIDYFCQLSEFWLLYNYGSIEREWIIHDGEADIVTRDQFFSTERAGGTVASSAHQLALRLIQEKYPPSKWNIYLFYFSDGFNYGDDDEKCVSLIGGNLLPIINQYAYLEVESYRRWLDIRPDDSSVDKVFSPAGNFGLLLAETFKGNPLVRAANLQELKDVPKSIQAVFSEGN